MRNPLKRSPTAAPKPTLRERFAAMKTKAAGFAPETSQGRRAMLAGSVAAALPLPALAATVQAGDREAAFLALAPEIVPLVQRLGPALAESHRRNEAAEAEAAPFPGWRDEAVGNAWLARLHAAKAVHGCAEAWDAGNALCTALAHLADPFINEPMRTLPGIMLKAALNDLGEWWGESALADVSRLAAEHFGLPAPAPYHQDLAPPEGDDEDA
ncbi:hypothetical protein [Methylobacterium sp. WL8]|uniref:hypothetical protein n=1 Tax=Methylobacterium sp. WL8 TaxID=2603899 RepID=UPI0011C7F675|nr:hypothetical protein [Methylobacterium sp. WL8]TXN72740.1 hypothetical protein FV234_25775 [Methylobacterium sp. WL8]